jgi:hypothetical protein
MDFSFDDYSNFSAQHVSPNGRTLTLTNYPHNFYSHGPCSYCSDPYHNASNCLSWGQFCNLSCEQMNTNFSSLGFDYDSNVYNPDWSNIQISRGKLKPWEIVLPNFMNCTILNIRSSKTKSLILHHMILFLNNLHWKKS